MWDGVCIGRLPRGIKGRMRAGIVLLFAVSGCCAFSGPVWNGPVSDHFDGRHFLPPVRYRDIVSITRFCNEYAARVRQLPGVQGATISASSPPDDQWKQNFTIDGRPLSRLQDTPVAARNATDSHYLRALGIPVMEGRDFSDSDTETSLPVALVNQAFVKQYFPSEDPIGKRIRISASQQLGADRSHDEVFTIVGVI